MMHALRSFWLLGFGGGVTNPFGPEIHGAERNQPLTRTLVRS